MNTNFHPNELSEFNKEDGQNIEAHQDVEEDPAKYFVGQGRRDEEFNLGKELHLGKTETARKPLPRSLRKLLNLGMIVALAGTNYHCGKPAEINVSNWYSKNVSNSNYSVHSEYLTQRENNPLNVSWNQYVDLISEKNKINKLEGTILLPDLSKAKIQTQ